MRNKEHTWTGILYDEKSKDDIRTIVERDINLASDLLTEEELADYGNDELLLDEEGHELDTDDIVNIIYENNLLRRLIQLNGISEWAKVKEEFK